MCASFGHAAAPRFIVDVNVGCLAKWLLVTGHDAILIPDVDDADLLKTADRQGRIVITRDRHIMERRVVTSGRVRVILITSDHFRRQMQQVTQSLSLVFERGFTICIECNAPLEQIAKDMARDKVPPFVYSTQDRFHQCPRCGKYYWRGTHWHNMRRELAGSRGKS